MRIGRKRSSVDDHQADAVAATHVTMASVRRWRNVERRLKKRLDELGMLTKARKRAGGSANRDLPVTASVTSVPPSQKPDAAFGGKLFSRGHLYWFLSNPIYAGDIRHKEQIVTGQHDAIIDRLRWDAVQKTLKEQTNVRSRSGNLGSRSLLGGLLFDDTGDRLNPSHAIKDGKQYRYYISQRLM